MRMSRQLEKEIDKVWVVKNNIINKSRRNTDYQKWKMTRHRFINTNNKQWWTISTKNKSDQLQNLVEMKIKSQHCTKTTYHLSNTIRCCALHYIIASGRFLCREIFFQKTRRICIIIYRMAIFFLLIKYILEKYPDNYFLILRMPSTT